jgi:hypothetical protein
MNKWSRHKYVASLYMMNNKDTRIVKISSLHFGYFFISIYSMLVHYLVYPSCFSFRVI